MPDMRAVSNDMFAQRIAMRLMSMETFIETLASGTLRRNRRIGMKSGSHAMHDRVAWEFGGGFESCPESFVTWGEARSEWDSKPITEAGWSTERYAAICLFPGDEMESKWISINEGGEDHKHRAGVGIIIRKTSASWLTPGHIVFAIIAEYSTDKHKFLKARNPC